MARNSTLAVLLAVGLVLVGGVGTATAHEWQTTVTQGPMELGISATPETPKAGMTTEFAGRIADSDYEGDANRTSWGGVVNAAVEVHIRGPDGYHDHVRTAIPEDGAHFHFSYVFPEPGNYSVAVVTQLEGQEYAFQFDVQVTLLPARADGERMDHLSEEVHAVNEKVDAIEDLEAKVDTLQSQVETLQATVEEQEGTQANDGQPDLGTYSLLLAIGVALGGGAVVVTRRR